MNTTIILLYPYSWLVKFWLLFIIIITTLLGCSPLPPTSSPPPQSQSWVRHDEWSDKTNFVDWDISRPNTALGVGFVAEENRHIPPYERPSTAKFELQAGEPFLMLLLLSAGGEKPKSVLVSVFLDYEQVSFRLDGQLGLLHELSIEAGRDMEIPMEVDVNSPGWHDMFVVVFREPSSHPTSLEERQFTDLSVAGRRTVLCSDHCTIKEESLERAKVVVGQEVDGQRHDIEAWAVTPGDAPPNDRVLFMTTAQAGEPLPIELWAANSSEKERNYVVLPLLDYQQFSFGGASALHLQMPPASELFIPGEIEVSAEPNVHELQFVTIFDPYQDLETVGDPFVNSLLRSGIVVEGK